MKIPFQDIKEADKELQEDILSAVDRVVRSGRYIYGPEVNAFEKELAKTIGVRHCISVSTGLDALRLILLGYLELGILKPGDEIIVPANTFIATFLAVTSCNLVAVAADVDETTFCLDLKNLPLTDKTKAIIPVHLFGAPCWDDTVFNALHSKGLLIIEDNAQALGASTSYTGFNKSHFTGNLGDAAAISFYPAKNIGAYGDAGAIVTNDDDLATIVRQLANYGSIEKYQHNLCGFNCRTDEIQAAILRIKLQHLDEITRRRGERARIYDNLITNPDIIKPKTGKHILTHAWHQYVIRHPDRNNLRYYLEKQGVTTEIHYPVPCHLQPCYKQHSLFKSAPSLPVAEQLAQEILSLPIANVSEGQIERIAEIINGF